MESVIFVAWAAAPAWRRSRAAAAVWHVRRRIRRRVSSVHLKCRETATCVRGRAPGERPAGSPRCSSVPDYRPKGVATDGILLGHKWGRRSVLPRDHARLELLAGARLATRTCPVDGALVLRRRVAFLLRRPYVALPVGGELASDAEGGGIPGLGNTVGSNASADIAGRSRDDGRLVAAACVCWPWGVFVK